MDELLKIIAKLGIELHPDRIAIVASKIETIGTVEQLALVKSTFGPNTDKELINLFDVAWQHNKDISPRDVASALRGASATALQIEKHGTTELVWSGPTAGQIPIRHTEQVLCEIINSAKQKIFIVSFVAYKVDSIIQSIRNAIGRNVTINILLELSKEHGGRIDNQDSVAMMKPLFPTANIFTWSHDNESTAGNITGAVHAKCAVADGNIAFITSANLTTAAMDKNMELGVLVKGGYLPLKLHQHLESLVLSNIIKREAP
jgi:phosphatidylserine/phosphatidylglycerophosphate/cardiolipin synthase-like enzyme